MSGDYANRLSDYPNKGICGLPERHESTRSLATKVNRLYKLIKESKKTVVLTGAGISTAAGIPDFRGPQGIWTMELNSHSNIKRRRLNKVSHLKLEENPCTGFQNVPPTYTHMTLAKLLELNIIDYIITQNVDGLHLRSGVPRSKLSILHGDCFIEKCEKCRKEYVRDFDIGGVSFKKTGRYCKTRRCGGALRDTILDWEDELPCEDFNKAIYECENADLVLALGTSLRIVPAGTLPLKAKRFVIVNLQVTPYNNEAILVIQHTVDAVFSELMKKLEDGTTTIHNSTENERGLLLVK